MNDGPAGTIRVPRSGDAPLPPENAVAAETQVPEQEAVHESLAAKLRAKRAEIEAGIEQLSVPGWDDELVLEIAPLRDRKVVAKGLTNEQLILAVTQRVLYRDDDGELQDLQGWAGAGRIMGLTGPDVSLGQIVRLVLDNPLRLDGFAADILSWIMGRKSVIDSVLGEQ